MDREHTILKHGTFSFVCVRGKWKGDLKNPSTASPSNSRGQPRLKVVTSDGSTAADSLEFCRWHTPPNGEQKKN